MSSSTPTASRLFEATGPYDRRLALRAGGVLRTANEAGLITAADVHAATRVAALVDEGDEQVVLALALATRAVGSGSTCLDLAHAADPSVPLDWPEPPTWLAAVESSRLAAAGVLRVEHGLVYLARYHEQEVQVADDLQTRARLSPPTVEEAVLTAGLDRLFDAGDADQRAAARAATHGRTTVITGGPGTGKTTTVARILSLLVEQAEHTSAAPPRIALTAPTAKAATRLRSAVGEATAALPSTDQERLGGLEASTMHKLLGWKPGARSRFRHDRANRLPHDVVVVDEASMVSLTLMARLLEALRPEARLLVVGDADQLAAVEAGAVLADLVAGLQQRAEHERAQPVVRLTHTYRFGGAIGDLAQAIRSGDADAALAVLAGDDDTVTMVDDPAALRGSLVRSALDLRRHALDGDDVAALRVLERHRLLVAHRAGPYGVAAWNRHLEQWLAEETGEGIWGPTYAGRPILITANDYANDLLNGDTGVVVRGPDGVLRATLDTAKGQRTYAASRLSDVETMHAMTVHKAQGSQARHITMLLPESDSPLLTRELLYTGVTRAEESVTVVGTPDTVRAAIERRSQRASGLALRLGRPRRSTDGAVS